MNITLVETVGWVGALSVVTAYLLISLHKLPVDSYRYHGLNIGGSILLALYALWKDALASTFVNVVWMAIGFYAVAVMLRKRRA